jgi:hypothetical protein
VFCLLVSLEGLAGQLDVIVGNQVKENKNHTKLAAVREEKSTSNKWIHNSNFAKELWKTVGDYLILVFPFLFVSWRTLCFAKQKMQNRWSCSNYIFNYI